MEEGEGRSTSLLLRLRSSEGVVLDRGVVNWVHQETYTFKLIFFLLQKKDKFPICPSEADSSDQNHYRMDVGRTLPSYFII